MNTQPSNTSSEALEQLLQQKLYEFSVAEESGQDREQLNAIYKEIKDIRYKITFGESSQKTALG